METMFVKAVKKFQSFQFDKLEQLKQETLENNKKILIFYTAQYYELSKAVVEFLGKKNIEQEPRQVLGCSKIILSEKQKKSCEILVLADGRFHALPLSINNKKEVYVFNGFGLNKISSKDIEQSEKQKKIKQTKYLVANNIGLICSVKEHQCNFSQLERFFQEIKKEKKKNLYAFIFETLNFQELENFCLDVYVNFSCPGIEKDNLKIVNFDSLNIQ
jgi:diphthamide biosynthesis enzyme Dph1/Dph2-like protein